jgi:hypothetical protein
MGAALCLSACGASASVQSLTYEQFEAIKAACDAPTATLMETPEGRAVAFAGIVPDPLQMKPVVGCIQRRLEGTDVRFIGFISEPPK